MRVEVDSEIHIVGDVQAIGCPRLTKLMDHERVAGAIIDRQDTTWVDLVETRADVLAFRLGSHRHLTISLRFTRRVRYAVLTSPSADGDVLTKWTQTFINSRPN